MTLKLSANKIHTGKTKSFDDIVAEFRSNKEAQVKTAASEEAVVVASDKEKDEADSSGQLDVEPLHQVGESTPSPHKGKDDKSEKAEAEAETEEVKEAKKELPQALKDNQFKKKDDDGKEKEDDKEASEDSEVKEAAETKNDNDKDEADSSGQPEWEGKDENNNDPDSGKHRDGDGDQKDAAAEGEKVVEASCACKSCNDHEDDCDCDGCGKECMAAANEEVKEAQAVKFVKLSDLKDNSKSKFIQYWTQLYGPDYANAMAADK